MHLIRAIAFATAAAAAAPVPEDKGPRAQNKDLRAENEDLRERLAAAKAGLELATSAESPAKAFVKSLFFEDPSNASEVEALREQLAAAESRAATAESRAAAELAAAETRATTAEASLAAAESRAATAEASLAASTTQVKDSALENKDLRERDAALEAAVPHRHLNGACDAATAALLKFLGYDPATTTDLRGPPRPRRPARRATAPRRRRNLYRNDITGPIPAEIGQLTALTNLRVPPAFPTPGAARERPSASQGSHEEPDHRPDPARDRPAHGAEGAASSPRASDARRGAPPPWPNRRAKFSC